MRVSRLVRATLLTVTVAATGCSGQVGEPGSPTPGGSPPGVTPPGGGGTGGTGAVADPNAAGAMPLQRLTNREYDNTVRDLLGDASQPASQFPTDHDLGLVFRRPGAVAVQDATLLRTAAETLAAAAVKNIATLVPCTTADDACARQFITTFGQRAFRRPVSAEDADRLFKLYTAGRTTLMLPFADAIGLVIEGMLQSWEFLYHWEAAASEKAVKEGGVLRLGPYQTASRLSYFIWGSMPDDALLAAAAAGKLNAPAGVETEARRLLADPKAKDTVASFFTDWLELDRLAQTTKTAATYPEYTPALQDAMASETETFVQNVVFDGDGKLTTLLNAKFSFVNQALGKVYGATVTGTDLQRTDLNATQRAGFLTHPGFLALNGSADGSNPVRRGNAVYTKLLCKELPPPPANVPAPKPASAGVTTRQRFMDHDQNPCAMACHGVMDPIGFAFENFDGIGKFRTTDSGQPVDASGTVPLDGTSHSFRNAVELADLLAASAEVRDCFSTQWLRFALSRIETDADLASVRSAAKGFADAGGKIHDLMVAVSATRSFRYRSLSQGEVMP
ncbi:MAG TPA: DUF1592 domain-containing protein [Polyangia bacterium]|nr:DUF1592 domain-containing protein [Polyangia bacterium]